MIVFKFNINKIMIIFSVNIILPQIIIYPHMVIIMYYDSTEVLQFLL